MTFNIINASKDFMLKPGYILSHKKFKIRGKNGHVTEYQVTWQAEIYNTSIIKQFFTYADAWICRLKADEKEQLLKSKNESYSRLSELHYLRAKYHQTDWQPIKDEMLRKIYGKTN